MVISLYQVEKRDYRLRLHRLCQWEAVQRLSGWAVQVLFQAGKHTRQAASWLLPVLSEE